MFKIMFHVWIGDSLPEAYRQNIYANHAILPEGARHVLISDDVIDCCEHFSYSEYIAHIRQDRQWNRLLHDFVCARECSGYTQKTAESDVVRAYYAMENGNCLYSDCDLRWKQIPDISDTSKVYFSLLNDFYDYFAFADNGNVDILMGIMRDVGELKTKSKHSFVSIINSWKYKNVISGISFVNFEHGK